jgi:hypothetical protein
MNMQKNERMLQVKRMQAGIADSCDEQADVYELSDEQLESVHGSAGSGGGSTGGLLSDPNGLGGLTGSVGLLGGVLK